MTGPERAARPKDRREAGARAVSIAAILVVVLLAVAGSRAALSGAGDRTAPVVAPGDLPESLTSQQFASLSSELSEPGGFFDSDNLVSNEASYLHILGVVREFGSTGGVFVGVGPDQGFSYIAASRPQMAFIVDIRRDNLLLHLLYKAAFHEADNRVEFLSLFFGRPLPDDPAHWNDLPVSDVVEWVDEQPATDASRVESARRLFSRLESFELQLSGEDMATIRRFHDGYVDRGLDIRFESLGRPSVRQVKPDFSCKLKGACHVKCL